MRRGRSQFIKLGIGAIIGLTIFYLLWSDPNAHTRAKQAISARFSANKPKERPILVKGISLSSFRIRFCKLE